MSGCQVVPEGLADIPPGPRLAHVLSEIDLARLTGFDCVQVLKARYRRLNHERAQLMAAMVEIGLCGIGPDDQPRRMTVPDEFSADEIRAALALTRRSADAQFGLAYDLITRLTTVHAAMDTGVLDEPRARLLSEWITELHPETARALCAELLPRAHGLTTGQLIEQIKKLAIALDPQWAQRRYEQALADRKVISSRNPDGSANLSGLNLPLDRVAAACGRIDALAKAAKHAGDPRPLDHIRADLFLGMTDGTYTGLDDTAILQRLHATHHSDEPDGDEPDGDEPDGDEPDGDEPDGDEADGEEAGEGGNKPGETGLDHDGPADSDAATEDGRGAAGEPVAQRRPFGTRMELWVRLSTLLGRDEYPAELAGWGPVHADLAHQHTSAQRSAAADPTRRFPGTALRRYVQIRDRSCIMIGCRAPARSTDTDHTYDHARGGATADHNLGTLCRHDHRLKHEGGWQLHQPDPGVFCWTSRLGHTYHRHTPAIIEPLPDPLSHDQPSYPLRIP